MSLRPRLTRELSGAVADLGVLIPIAVALIVKNGLSATAVLLPAGGLYLLVAAVYRLPVPVQPLKALGAIAIAQGLGSDEIAAAAILMGAIFLVIGATGIVDLAGRAFPKPLIRACSSPSACCFSRSPGAWSPTPDLFSAFALAPAWAVPLGVAVVVVAVLLRRRPVTLVLVAIGIGAMLVRAGDELAPGPSALTVPSLDAATFWTAFTVLVIPQLPLSFANSCLATADAARSYFGDAAERVRAGRLAMTLGSANVFAGAISGMPVCHGAGGLTAHVAFGARTWRAPAAMGTALVVVALGAGAGLATVSAGLPAPDPRGAARRRRAPAHRAAARSRRRQGMGDRVARRRARVRGQPPRRTRRGAGRVVAPGGRRSLARRTAARRTAALVSRSLRP